VSDADRTMTISVECRGPLSRCSSSVCAWSDSGLFADRVWVVSAPLSRRDVSRPPMASNTSHPPITRHGCRALPRAMDCADTLTNLPLSPRRRAEATLPWHRQFASPASPAESAVLALRSPVPGPDPGVWSRWLLHLHGIAFPSWVHCSTLLRRARYMFDYSQ
jgi:hypothetical protein